MLQDVQNVSRTISTKNSTSQKMVIVPLQFTRRRKGVAQIIAKYDTVVTEYNLFTDSFPPPGEPHVLVSSEATNGSSPYGCQTVVVGHSGKRQSPEGGNPRKVWKLLLFFLTSRNDCFVKAHSKSCRKYSSPSWSSLHLPRPIW